LLKRKGNSFVEKRRAATEELEGQWIKINGQREEGKGRKTTPRGSPLKSNSGSKQGSIKLGGQKGRKKKRMQAVTE